MADLLTESEATEIEIPTNGVSNAIGEIKKRRGRPPGSKNKPREETVTPSIENAIKGLFGFMALIAGWFGYEQTEELTDSEAKDGARAFTPIIQKHPWLTPWLSYIGAPIWLLLTMRKKFAKKETPTNEAVDNSDNDSVSAPPNPDKPVDGPERFEGNDNPRSSLGSIQAGG